MSLPNIPDINPDITIDRRQVINLLLASIALEEIGLSHIINTEAEKIQYVLGTLVGQTQPLTPTIDELLEINSSVEQTLRSVIKKEMLLEFKLEDVLRIPDRNIIVHENTAVVTATFNGTEISDSDSAFYYTEEQGVI